MKFENRTIVISGGSSGMGLATVHELIGLKAYVVNADCIPPHSGSDLPASHVKFIQTDLADVSQIESTVERAVAWTLETKAPLGGVINCAGIVVLGKTVDEENEPFPLDKWNTILAVNLSGTFHLTRLTLKHLVKVDPEDGPDGERGVVIMVSSSSAFEGQTTQVAYAASKGGILAMTTPMAQDLARYAIRVVGIAPGPFDSNMTVNMPQVLRSRLERDAVVYPRRFGQPAEFAKTVKWIIECAFVNGETIRLSAGGRLPGPGDD